MITSRKLKVRCEDKSFYDFFKIEQREQNKALNMAISLRHINNTFKSIDSGAEVILLRSIDNLSKKIKKLEDDLNSEKISDKKKAQILKAIETNSKIIAGEYKKLEEGRVYRKGIDKEFSKNYFDKTQLYHVLDGMTNIQYKRTIELVRQKVKNDYSNNFVDIVTGKQSLPSYKSDFPLMIDGSCITLFKENEIYKLKIMLGYELEVILGRRENENTLEIKRTLDKIIEDNELFKNSKKQDIPYEKKYKINQSSIQKDKNGNIIFNLCITMPDSFTYKPVKDRVLGVDLGIKYPVYMALGDDTYKKQHIGSINNFLRVRQQMQERDRNLRRSLKLTNGGKGRKKKLQALEKLKQNERNFVKTYNHALSKRVVEFAKSNKCEYIHIEKLTKDGFNNAILRNWSYFELQNMIKYKADRFGIKVRYVDPSYTSQKCSSINCGHIDKKNRPSQEKFKCIKCGYELNADHNAAINIARSDNFIK